MSGRQHVAFADCERIRDGWVGQPANAASSLAFVVAAVPIARSARARRRPVWLAVAAAAAIEGLGSVGYHGPGGRWSKVVHDAGIVALVGTVTAAVVADAAPRPVVPPRAAVLGAAAVVVHTLSRTGGPWCRCDSRLQGHAVFHLLAAAALASAVPTAPPADRRTSATG
ncbi:MAG: hypothetical protein ACSLFP_09580 [Acidimicrobiales bacterium]